MSRLENSILEKELQNLIVRKRFFFKIAQSATEYQRNFIPNEEFIQKLSERKIDIFTFLDRAWSSPISFSSKSWAKANDNIALLHLATFDEWWKKIGDKTRNRARKAEKSGVKISTAPPSEKLAEDMWRIYNETPIRQKRSFFHYGISKETVMRDLSPENTYIVAYLQDELIGFITLVHGDDITLISQMMSLLEHRDKLASNALIAKAIEICAKRHVQWVMCGRMGNHPSLDDFKEKNGFVKFDLTRYYVPVTKKGRIAVKLKLHRELKDSLPASMKSPLFPIFNWVSRTKQRLKLSLLSRQ